MIPAVSFGMTGTRTLHVIDSLDPFGGASVACLRLAKGLADAGDTVHIASADPPEGLSIVDPERVKLTLWPRDGAMGSILDDAIAAADVVHLHGVWDPALREAAQRCRRAGKPYVLTPHGMLSTWPMAQKPWRKRLYLATAGRAMLRGAHTVHLTAEAERDQASRWVPRAKTWVAPLVNDLSTYLDASLDPTGCPAIPDRPTDAPVALFLSRLHPKKGPDRAIAALPLIPRLHLAMAGRDDPAYRAELIAGAQRLGVADRVHWVGEVSEAEKIQLYQNVDFFLLPTHQENFGQVLVEAMAVNCPVVVTKGTDIWAKLEEGGAVISGPEPEALAAAINPLLDDPEALKQRGLRGRPFVRGWLDPVACVQPYRERYARMMR